MSRQSFTNLVMAGIWTEGGIQTKARVVDKLCELIRAQVSGRVWDQVGGAAMNQVWFQFGALAWGQITANVRNQLRSLDDE